VGFAALNRSYPVLISRNVGELCRFFLVSRLNLFF
jgi:hypothetical protein